MRKIFLTFIVLTFVHIIFAQNKQTIVVRPETKLEKTVREAKDAKEVANFFGEMFQGAAADRLNEVKNSRYSVFVEKKLETWKQKGAFEKTADWQKRLNDSTAIKKAEIYESALDEFVQVLKVLNNDNTSLNGLFYDSKGYDADREVLVINTVWGNTPIPIPLDEAKNMQNDFQNLNTSFLDQPRVGLKPLLFIQNDKLALASLTFPRQGKIYTWENQSPAAQIARNKRHELEQKMAMELAEKGREEEKPFVSVEQMPQFPGGNAELMKFIDSNLKYPQLAVKDSIQGRVILRFVVGKDGSLTNIRVQKGLESSCDNEAIRVVKLMPKWIPGKQNGQNLPVYFTLPVVFRLQK